MKKASITDIAKKAGVSIASVSYVLNGREKERRVSKEVAERIRRVADELNYRPSHIARSLRQGSTKTIGLIVPDISNPYFGDLAKAIEEQAASRGFMVIFGSSDENPDKSARLIDTLLSRQVDGIILAPVENAEKRVAELNKKLPLVLVDRFLDQPNVSYVALNNYQAAYDAVKYLAENGHRRIGFIAYDSKMRHLEERLRGYQEAMKKYNQGSPLLTAKIRYTSIQADVDNAISAFYQEPEGVDAIVFATNTLTVAGLYYFNTNKIRIPEDLAIIGFDGNVAFDFFYSPLSYMRQPITEIGKKAVDILVNNIEGKPSLQQHLLAPELIKRASS